MLCDGEKCNCAWQLGCGLVSCFSLSSGRSMSVGGGVDVLVVLVLFVMKWDVLIMVTYFD